MYGEPIRSHHFNVTIDGLPVKFMKVSGLAAPSRKETIVKFTRGIFHPVDSYLKEWYNSRHVVVEVEYRGPLATETVMAFEFDATPLVHYYSDLDAGSNQIFTETLQVYAEGIEVTW